MFHWDIVYFVIAIVTVILGLRILVGTVAWGIKMIFIIGIIFFIINLISRRL